MGQYYTMRHLQQCAHELSSSDGQVNAMVKPSGIASHIPSRYSAVCRAGRAESSSAAALQQHHPQSQHPDRSVPQLCRDKNKAVVSCSACHQAARRAGSATQGSHCSSQGCCANAADSHVSPAHVVVSCCMSAIHSYRGERQCWQLPKMLCRCSRSSC